MCNNKVLLIKFWELLLVSGMQYFLVLVSYARKAWSTLINRLQNRLDSLRPAIESLRERGEFLFDDRGLRCAGCS